MDLQSRPPHKTDQIVWRRNQAQPQRLYQPLPLSQHLPQSLHKCRNQQHNLPHNKPQLQLNRLFHNRQLHNNSPNLQLLKLQNL